MKFLIFSILVSFSIHAFGYEYYCEVVDELAPPSWPPSFLYISSHDNKVETIDYLSPTPQEDGSFRPKYERIFDSETIFGFEIRNCSPNDNEIFDQIGEIHLRSSCRIFESNQKLLLNANLSFNEGGLVSVVIFEDNQNIIQRSIRTLSCEE